MFLIVDTRTQNKLHIFYKENLNAFLIFIAQKVSLKFIKIDRKTFGPGLKYQSLEVSFEDDENKKREKMLQPRSF